MMAHLIPTPGCPCEECEEARRTVTPLPESAATGEEIVPPPAHGERDAPAEVDDCKRRADEAWTAYKKAYCSDTPFFEVMTVYENWRDADRRYETAKSATSGSDPSSQTREVNDGR